MGDTRLEQPYDRIVRDTPAPPEAAVLTDLQLDALRRAVALGYYKIPREIHLSELAAKLGVSPAALSERLRRAEGRLIAHHIARVQAPPLAEPVFEDGVDDDARNGLSLP